MFQYWPEHKVWSYAIMRLIAQASYGGGDFNEIHRAAAKMTVGDWDSWRDGWTALGDECVALADDALAAGHTVTARKALLRASNYYRTAQHFVEPADPRKRAGYDRCAEAFRRGMELMEPPVRPVRIPYEGTSLPAYFFIAPGLQGAAPTVIFTAGADSYAEESYFRGIPEALERGMSVLAIDGPGQGGALWEGLVLRPDWETPMGAAVDWLEGQDVVDNARIGIIGNSIGGYLAPRAMAFEPRLKAGVAWGACFDMGPDLYEFYPTIRPQLEFILGARGEADAREKLKAYTLAGVAERITTPLMVVHGEEDFLVKKEGAFETYNRAQGPKVLKIWQPEEGGALHCQHDNYVRAQPFMWDWLADQLRA